MFGSPHAALGPNRAVRQWRGRSWPVETLPNGIAAAPLHPDARLYALTSLRARLAAYDADPDGWIAKARERIVPPPLDLGGK
jgi:hypothetical protein